MPRPHHAVGGSGNSSSAIEVGEIVDEVHELADPFGDLSSDPSSDRDRVAAIDRAKDLQADPQGDPHDDPEVWFEAEALAAASTVELGESARLERRREHDPIATPLEQLAALAVPGVSLARLPGWPGAGPTGQGLGELADELVGELRPGDLLLFGARERAAGRSALLAQLGDGLALADEPGRASTPVLCAIEGGPALWRARSLARFSGVDARVFVESARVGAPERARLLDAFARSTWARLDDRQRFVDAAALAEPRARKAALAGLRRWSLELRERTGAATIWPIVIVDPLERLAEQPRDVIAALEGLAELARAEGLIVLASCDVTGDPSWARAVDGRVSARLELSAIDEQTLALELCHRRLGPRGSGRSLWHRPSGRFSPASLARGCPPRATPEY